MAASAGAGDSWRPSRIRLILLFPPDSYSDMADLLSQLSKEPDLAVIGQGIDKLDWAACPVALDQPTVVMILSRLLVSGDPEAVNAFLASPPPFVRVLVLQHQDRGFPDLTTLILHHVWGCLTMDTPLSVYLKAIHSICRGELWFPRWALTEALHWFLAGPYADAPPQAALMAQDASPALNSLTARERDIVRLLRQGLTNKGIAQQLGVSDQTVKMHLRHVFQKLGVNNRTQLALRLGRR
jgi:DNA-binding NarL/FixJ family response regulator